MYRIAACRVYNGAAYTDGDALAYLDRSSEYQMMHPVTHQQLRFLLTMLRDHGEQALFAFIRQVVLPGKPFALEPPACQEG